MDTPQAPGAPDANKTAETQSKYNRETAVTQYGLNATNQKTPWGSLKYNQVGTWADGTPRYEMSTELSPEMQGLFGAGNRTRQSLADNASRQAAGLSSDPFKLGNDQTEGRLFDLGRKRLDPMFQQKTNALETNLINRGLRPGTEAYRRAMMENTKGQNDAYDQLLLSGRSLADQELTAERNQPINEIMSFLNASQVNNPQFGQGPQVGVAPTDFIGAQQQNLNQQNLSWQAQQQQQMAMMNGLFGLGKTALGAASGGMGGFGGSFGGWGA